MEPDDLRQLLADNVRRLAATRDLSLNHLADFAGISRASLLHALACRNAMTTDRICKLANVLEVHPSELLADVEAPALARAANPRRRRKG